MTERMSVFLFYLLGSILYAGLKALNTFRLFFMPEDEQAAWAARPLPDSKDAIRLELNEIGNVADVGSALRQREEALARKLIEMEKEGG